MSLTIKVDNRVRLSEKELARYPHVRESLCSLFSHVNPQFKYKERLGYPHNEEPIIRTWQSKGDEFSLPRGGMSRVRQTCYENNIVPRVSDERTSGYDRDGEYGTIPDHLFKLRDYQRESLEIAIKRQNCLIRAPTGSGKTTVAFAIAAQLKLPTLVIVWSGNLFDQWVKRAQTELGLTPDQIGQIRGSKYKIRPLTIAMQQSLSAKGITHELKTRFGVVICDEVQRFAARTLFATVDPFPAQYRIGISADQTRKDRKDFLIYDLFGRVEADISTDRLVSDGTILDVEIRVIPTDFRADWYARTREFDKLLTAIGEDTVRNELILHHVRDEVLNNQEQVFVLTHRREHCRTLDTRLTELGIRSGFLIGGADYVEEFRKTRKSLEEGTTRVGVGTIQSIGQGLDIPRVGVAVVTTPLAANRQQFGQVRGRVCRAPEGKTSARLYYLWDRFVHGVSHLDNLIRWNKTVTIKTLSGWTSAKAYLQSIQSGAKESACVV